MSDKADMLPADVQAMLRVERIRLIAPEDGRSRLAERLSVAVPAFGAPHQPVSAPPPPAVPAVPLPPTLGPASALKAGLAKAVLVLAVGGGAAAAVGAVRHARRTVETRHPEPAQTALVSMARVPSPVAPLPAAVPPSVAIDPAETRGAGAALPARVLPGAPALSASAGPPTSSTASLTEEQRLLDAARDAVVRGEPEAALGPTATHAARFPQGVLAEERDALRIRALAHLGRKAEAQGLLRSMRAKYPTSFLLEGATVDVDAIP